MSDLCNRLIAEYFQSGTLSGLPARHFIDGRWCDSVGGQRMEIFDPGSGRAFTTVAAGRVDDVDRAVVSAQGGLVAWRRPRPAERGRALMRTAASILGQLDRLAVIEALDSGKTLAEAKSDVAGAARVFEYYGGAVDKLQGDSIPLGPGHIALTLVEPVGVVAQIIPWNYPISTFARGVAPALAAGCAVVVKPAETTPLTALLLGQILLEAGLPAGACNVVAGTGTEAGAPL